VCTNDPIETCEQIVTNMPVPPTFEQSDKAWYSPTNDVVGMPARGLFHSSEEYYATEFHELAHSTGHAKRLHGRVQGKAPDQLPEAWPAIRPAHSFLKFRAYSLNVLPSGFRFLDGDNQRIHSLRASAVISSHFARAAGSEKYRPPRSNLCGQTCIAMLLGISIDDALKLIGKRGCTRTRDLVKALRSQGFTCPDRAQRCDRDHPIPYDCIMKYSWRGRSKGHWVLRVGGVEYDPDGLPWPTPGGTVTSCIPFSTSLQDYIARYYLHHAIPQHITALDRAARRLGAPQYLSAASRDHE
jgi:hypothetical protein